MKNIDQFIGKTFGRTVIQRDAGKDERRNRIVECLCKCGKLHTSRLSSLVNGNTESCGCLNKERVSEWCKSDRRRKLITIHGLTRTITGASYTAMMQRCYNPNRKAYPGHGGKGIRVCEFLRGGPHNIISMIGERPSIDLTLDRENNKLHYSCGQCAECLEKGWKLNIRWATWNTQNNNKSSNVLINMNGITKTRAEWSETLGKSYGWCRKHLKPFEI